MEGKTHWGSLSTSPPTYTPKRDRTLFREARVIGPRGGRVRPTCREYEHGAELFGLLFGCGLGPPMVPPGTSQDRTRTTASSAYKARIA